LDQPFELIRDTSEVSFIALIKSNQVHKLKTEDDKCISLFFLPESDFSQTLIEYFNQNDTRIERIFNKKNNALSKKLLSYLTDTIGSTSANQVVKCIEYEFALKNIPIKKIDERIQKSLDFIDQNIFVTHQNIKEKVALSESRFIHLFKQEIGIPIKSYLLWKKIYAAVYLFDRKDLSLNDIAYEVGFSDAAHFSRTFMNMFGIQSSQLFHNDQIEIIVSAKKE